MGIVHVQRCIYRLAAEGGLQGARAILSVTDYWRACRTIWRLGFEVIALSDTWLHAAASPSFLQRPKAPNLDQLVPGLTRAHIAAISADDRSCCAQFESGVVNVRPCHAAVPG